MGISTDDGKHLSYRYPDEVLQTGVKYSFKILPDTDFVLSSQKVDCDVRILDDNTWIANACDIGGESGHPRKLAIYMVGPAGRALIRYFKEAESSHNSVRSLLKPGKEKEFQFLPLIKEKTPDTIMCAEVFIYRK